MRDGSALVGAAMLLAGAGGCHLIDQSSFGGAPRPPAPAELAAAFASDGRLPLLVVRPGDGVPYQDALRAAIEGAEARNGAARFRLMSVVPAQGDAAAQARALDANAAAAREVLDAMVMDGVSPERVTLDTRADPRSARREIWLYGS